MKLIKDTELILTNENRVYHLNLKKEEISKTIIIVGDQARVKTISKHFDRIDFVIKHREFITHTGVYNGKKISVVSTGIGTDNIDIVLNELDALVNVDFKTRKVNLKKEKLDIIRIGTSGALQEDIKVDTFIMAKYGLGFDGLAHYYKSNNIIDEQMSKEFIKHSNWPNKLAEPYIVSASNKLINKFSNFNSGITATASGFYAPQGRELRLKVAVNNFHDKINTFNSKGNRILNFEMETSALYFLGKSLGHNTLTICAIMGNRITKEYSKNYSKTIENLVVSVLEKM